MEEEREEALVDEEDEERSDEMPNPLSDIDEATEDEEEDTNMDARFIEAYFGRLEGTATMEPEG